MKLKSESMSEDIDLLISEIKIRRRMNDEQVGKAIGLKKSSIRNHRNTRTFPNMPFWRVYEIAKLAGYEVVFEKKE